MPEFKAILALDTALNHCSAAVFSAGKKAAETVPMAQGHGEHLMPMVERVLAAAGVQYSELDAIATTVGPGAFTGLRIGLSAARGLALALDVPLYGMTTTQILALQQVRQSAGPCAVIVETKRADFYFQMFDGRGHAVAEAEALPGEEIAAMIGGKKLTLLGDGLERFRPFVQSQSFDLSSVNVPDMALMAEMLTREPALFIEGAEPVYLRGADVTLSKKQNRVFEGITDTSKK